jgi:hypothetical protein
MAVTHPVRSDEDPKDQPEVRSAVLFISGLGEATVDQSAEGIAVRMGHSLNRYAGERKATYAVLPGATEVRTTGDLKLERATIQRTAPDGSTAALDVWRLATSEELTDDYEQASLWVKLYRGARIVLRYSRLFELLLFWRSKPAKRAKDRAQLWMVRLMIALIAVYLAGLVVAFLGEVASMDWVPDWASAAVLAVTGLGIWRAKAVKRLTTTAVQLNCLLDYIGEGDSVSEFRGHVADTLEHFAEQSDVVYDRIDLIAYSFGSMVALDALFPRADMPGGGYDQLTTFITIGCPFDLVRTYWPSYYTNRHRRDGVPARWINFSSPRDVFGSDFKSTKDLPIGVGLIDSVDQARPEKHQDWIVVAEDAREIRWWQLLRFPGVKAHGHYWETDAPNAESVYSPLVRELYAGHVLLA